MRNEHQVTKYKQYEYNNLHTYNQPIKLDDTFQQSFCHQIVSQTNMCYAKNLCNNATLVDPYPCKYPNDLKTLAHFHQTLNNGLGHLLLSSLKVITQYELNIQIHGMVYDIMSNLLVALASSFCSYVFIISNALFSSYRG